MRLWHQAMLPYLSRQHLLGQHRECCALRGLGWGKKHSTVDYVFTYPPEFLYVYHQVVIGSMPSAAIEALWVDSPSYRGRRAESWAATDWALIDKLWAADEAGELVYPEHTPEYYVECRNNLIGKGFDVDQIPETVDGCNPYG